MPMKKEPIDLALSQRLDAAMKSRGFSQSELSRKSRIAQATIGRIVRGEVSPTTRTLNALANALDMRATHLLDGMRTCDARTETIRTDAQMVSMPWWSGLSYPVVERMTVSRAWLEQRANFTAIAALAVAAGVDDSMAPTFTQGDLLLVDCGVKKLSGDGIYAFALARQTFIKRIQRGLDGSLSILSDNSKYIAQVLSAKRREEVSVLGRIVLAWSTSRL